MWIVIKYDRKKLNTLKHELKLKPGFDCVFYSPKILIQKFYKNKVINKEYEILGDYIFCSHIKLKDNEVIYDLSSIIPTIPIVGVGNTGTSFPSITD